MIKVRDPFALGCLAILGSFLTVAPSAHAAEFCVGSTEALRSALEEAQSNGANDVINVYRGTYVTPAPFTYAAGPSDADKDLRIVGGWTPPSGGLQLRCGRINRPFERFDHTVLRLSQSDVNPDKTALILTAGQDAALIVENLTFSSAGFRATAFDASQPVEDIVLRNNAFLAARAPVRLEHFSHALVIGNYFKDGQANIDVHGDSVHFVNNTIENPVDVSNAVDISGHRVFVGNNVLWGPPGTALVANSTEAPIVYNNIMSNSLFQFETSGVPFPIIHRLIALFPGLSSNGYPATSPARDFGEPPGSTGDFENFWSLPAFDLMGQPRVARYSVDAGAFESVQPMFINEIDPNTSGDDRLEFIELFGPARHPLDGLVVVFFDDASVASYAAFDLDGFRTNDQGMFVLGNAGVDAAELIFDDGLMHDGPAAVALFQADASDFPFATSAFAFESQRMDAVAYGDSITSAIADALGTLALSEAPSNGRGIEDPELWPLVFKDGHRGGKPITYHPASPGELNWPLDKPVDLELSHTTNVVCTVNEACPILLRLESESIFVITNVEIQLAPFSSTLESPDISADFDAFFAGSSLIWGIPVLNGFDRFATNLNITVTPTAVGNFPINAEISAQDQRDIDSAPDNDDGDQSEDDEIQFLIQVVPGPQSLNVSLLGGGSGRVTSPDYGIDCPNACSQTIDGGATVVLEVDPDAGSAFGGWTGDCLSAGMGPCELTMDQEKNVGARFILATSELPFEDGFED